MIALAYYLLKVILCSAILFLYYFAFLRNKLFHQWNRFYLLVAVVLSIVVPLVTYNVYEEKIADSGTAIQILQVVQTADDFVAEMEEQQAEGPSTEQWIGTGYLLISVLLFVCLLISIFRIGLLLRSHPVQEVDKIKVVETDARGTPFSFFRYIFWNRKIDIQTETGQQIFQHELVHVREGHSMDKLFLQTILSLFWCNPVFWLIRNELRMVHEFLADKKAVGEKGTAALAAMILQSVYPDHHRDLTSHFFQSSLKRRIAMLSKAKNPGWNYFSRIIALPFLALIILAFTVRTKEAPLQDIPLEREFVVVIDAGHGKEDAGARIGNIMEKDITLAIARQVLQLNRNEKLKIILTRDEDILPGLKDRVQMASDSRADLFISIHVNAMPLDPNTGKPKADSSGIVIYVPGNETSYQKESILLGSILQSQLGAVYPTSPTVRIRNKGVWVLNHNVCPNVLVECGYMTNEKDRRFITDKNSQQAMAKKILRAIEIYAFENQKTREKLEAGHDGPGLDPAPVADTVPKKTNLSNTIRVKDQNVPGKAPFTGLIFINDKLFNGTMDEIPLTPDDIASISVLKGDHTKKYGEKGKDGVILIYSKGYNKSGKDVEPEITKAEGPVFSVAEEPARIDPLVWRKFAQENFDIAGLVKNASMPEGNYQVLVKFIVETDGSITQLEAVSKNGHGLEEMVISGMRSAPKWVPAVQNGRKVRSWHVQPITFVVAPGDSRASEKTPAVSEQ